MQNLSSDLQQRALGIKLLILDVDGVLTDGRIFIRDNGEEIKSFHTLDGHGLKMLQASGVQTAIITGRDAPSVGIRVKQLGINYYFKGIHDKRSAYAQLREQAGVEEHECAFVGDDVVDLLGIGHIVGQGIVNFGISDVAAFFTHDNELAQTRALLFDTQRTVVVLVLVFFVVLIFRHGLLSRLIGCRRFTVMWPYLKAEQSFLL